MSNILELLSLDVEELRKELCLISYPLMKNRGEQIRNKLKEIDKMLKTQTIVHKNWDGFSIKEVKKE